LHISEIKENSLAFTNLTMPHWTLTDGDYWKILGTCQPRYADFRQRYPRSSWEI